MLCHVCKRAAVGQCKHCSRFYCAEHGRNGQVQWNQYSPTPAQTITLLEIALPTQIDIFLKDPDGFANHSYLNNPLRETACYHCDATALCSCARCGRLGCTSHVRKGEFFGDNQLYCHQCRPNRGVMAWSVVLIIALLWGGALAYWVLQ